MQAALAKSDGLDDRIRAARWVGGRVRLIGRRGHVVDERRLDIGVQPGADSRELLPLDRSGELRRHRRQPVLAPQARHRVPLPGRAWKDPADRRRARDSSNQADPRRQVHVVRDTVSERGRPIERTFDWYAQDKQGNVWYMGEDSLELHHGHFVKASDSWEAGVNGAKPGIIMPANPQPGDSYRQEYYPPGQALDQAHVLGYSGPVSVPYGTFKRSLVTSEFSPLEPQTEKKYYVAGVGEIEERVVKGHHEQFQLVSVTY